MSEVFGATPSEALRARTSRGSLNLECRPARAVRSGIRGTRRRRPIPGVIGDLPLHNRPVFAGDVAAVADRPGMLSVLALVVAGRGGLGEAGGRSPGVALRAIVPGGPVDGAERGAAVQFPSR